MRLWSRSIVAGAIAAILFGVTTERAFAAAGMPQRDAGQAAVTDKPLLLADDDRDRRRPSRRWKDDDDHRHSNRRRSRRDSAHMSPEDLEGTIWIAKEQHRRVTVTID